MQGSAYALNLGGGDHVDDRPVKSIIARINNAAD